MDAKMPLLLLVTLAKKPMAARPFQDATQLASAWALVTAGLFPISYALGSAVFYALCCNQQLLWRDLCEEEDAMLERALCIGLLCCAALQAAAAALALLLPCRRRQIRRAVAYLAVAAAIVGHCMMASLAPLAADTGLASLLLIPLIVYAAAALALLLPCRRRRIRHAPAYLAVAIVGHCMMASLAPLAADTGLASLLLIPLIVYAAAALVLLLPCRRRRIRNALAYLAVAILGCCILASFVPIAVDTGLGLLRLILLVVYVAAMFILAVGDLSFLALLLEGEFPWDC